MSNSAPAGRLFDGSKDMSSDTKGTGATRELVITRIIDAPRERVFEAWTKRLPEWWGRTV